VLELVWEESENKFFYVIPKNKKKVPEPCLRLFPQFKEDFEGLLEKRIITIDENKTKFIWNKSQLSLAQYFFDLEFLGKGIWSVVEPDFGIERGKLKQSISANKKQNGGKESKDYAEIKEILKPFRERAENIRKTYIRNKYLKIKKMVADWKEPMYCSEIEDFCGELEKTIREITALF
jgi:hypothetical protein